MKMTCPKKKKRAETFYGSTRSLLVPQSGLEHTLSKLLCQLIIYIDNLLYL